MPRSQATVRVHRPTDVVFANLVSHAWRNEPAWEPEILEVRPEGDGPLRLGSRAAMVRKESGKVITTTYEVVAFDPPRRIAFRHLDGPMRFALDFVVSPVGAATADVTVTVDIGLPGAMRLLTPLFVLIGPRRNERISRRMVAAIEAATAPGAPMSDQGGARRATSQA